MSAVALWQIIVIRSATLQKALPPAMTGWLLWYLEVFGHYSPPEHTPVLSKQWKSNILYVKRFIVLWLYMGLKCWFLKKKKKKIYLLQKNWENVRYRINQVKAFVVSHKWSDRSFPHAPYWGLFISQAVACHLARATKSSWERNDPWFHLNRRPHVVKSILCYWNNRQRLSCEARKPDLQQTRFFFFSQCH